MKSKKDSSRGVVGFDQKFWVEGFIASRDVGE